MNARDRQGAYFDDPVVGKLADLVLLITQELYVARRHSLALEALLARAGVIEPAGVDAFEPDEDEQRLLDGTQDLLSRFWTVLTDEGPANSPLREQWLLGLSGRAGGEHPVA